ncbi:hypothetical protein QFZ51_003884 [Chitinophaga sp. W3I9]
MNQVIYNDRVFFFLAEVVFLTDYADYADYFDFTFWIL